MEFVHGGLSLDSMGLDMDCHPHQLFCTFRGIFSHFGVGICNLFWVIISFLHFWVIHAYWGVLVAIWSWDLHYFHQPSHLGARAWIGSLHLHHRDWISYPQHQRLHFSTHLVEVGAIYIGLNY